MTPKEKAEELFDNHFLQQFIMEKQTAKIHALITVDEILEELFEMEMVTGSSYVHKHINYYKEVKQEPEKL